MEDQKNSIRIPKHVYAYLIDDYARAMFLSRRPGTCYSQGEADAIMRMLNYCWGLTSLEVQESKEFKQALIDIEASYISQHEKQ